VGGVRPLDGDSGGAARRSGSRRLELLRLEARRVGVGDVLGQELLAGLVPMQARLEHRDERQVGDGHGSGPLNPAKIAVIVVNAPLKGHDVGGSKLLTLVAAYCPSPSRS
jgi:hypothetical protein